MTEGQTPGGGDSGAGETGGGDEQRQAQGGLQAAGRLRFPGISPRAYEHPTDRGALVGLRSVPGFDAVLKALSGAINERSERLLLLATSLRVTRNQHPLLHRLRMECAAVLDLDAPPELYLQRDPRPNAMTIGMDRPFIVVTSGLVDLCDPEELRFVIGHECGHVLSGHALYRTMLLRLVQLATSVSWMPIGYWGLRAVIAALREWYRKSELSCDRAGLLCGQDAGAALRLHAKLAGANDPAQLDTGEFLRQATEYDAVADVRDSVLKLLQVTGSTHPMPVVRAAALQQWAAGQEYRDILSGQYPRRTDDPSTSWTAEMRGAANAYRESWAASEDPLAKVAASVAEGVSGAAGAVRRVFRPGTDEGSSNEGASNGGGSGSSG